MAPSSGAARLFGSCPSDTCPFDDLFLGMRKSLTCVDNKAIESPLLLSQTLRCFAPAPQAAAVCPPPAVGQSTRLQDGAGEQAQLPRAARHHRTTPWRSGSGGGSNARRSPSPSLETAGHAAAAAAAAAAAVAGDGRGG